MPPKLLRISANSSARAFLKNTRLAGPKNNRLVSSAARGARLSHYTHVLRATNLDLAKKNGVQKIPPHLVAPPKRVLQTQFDINVPAGILSSLDRALGKPVFLSESEPLQFQFSTIFTSASLLLTLTQIKAARLDFAPIQFRGHSSGSGLTRLKKDRGPSATKISKYAAFKTASSIPSRSQGILHALKQIAGHILGLVARDQPSPTSVRQVFAKLPADNRVIRVPHDIKKIAPQSKEKIKRNDVADCNESKDSDGTSVTQTRLPVDVSSPFVFRPSSPIQETAKPITVETLLTAEYLQDVSELINPQTQSQGHIQDQVFSVNGRSPFQMDPVALFERRLEVVAKRNAESSQVIQKIAQQLELLKNNWLKLGGNAESLKDITRLLKRAQLTQQLNLNHAQTLVGDLNAEIFRLHSKITTHLAAQQLPGQMTPKILGTQASIWDKWWAGYYSERIRRKLEYFTRRARKLLTQISLGEMLSGEDGGQERQPADPIAEKDPNEAVVPTGKFFRSTSEKGPVYEGLYDAFDSLDNIRNGNRH